MFKYLALVAAAAALRLASCPEGTVLKNGQCVAASFAEPVNKTASFAAPTNATAAFGEPAKNATAGFGADATNKTAAFDAPANATAKQ